MMTARSCYLVLFLAAAVVSGCATVRSDNRHLQPLPAKLVAQMGEKGMRPADPILVRIYKQESELEVWKQDRTGKFALLKTYPICRWSGQLGPKQRGGDRQAPEGFYTVTPAMMNPRSRYHLAFNLGYPNQLEQALGYSGAALMVHGACSSAGCFAMTDHGAAEIYALAREAFDGGQQSFQVQALPFRMVPQNLAVHRGNPNMPFWQNLKEGSDHFEATRQEPTVAACGYRYVFNVRTMDPAARFDAAAPCPTYEVDPELSQVVAAKQDRDHAMTAALVASGTPAISFAYVDGGMHAAYRTLLKSIGPDRLSRMTSSDVEVSRPEAVLAAPYPPVAGHIPSRVYQAVPR
jgi:murein L,D-transpeptidase YafK